MILAIKKDTKELYMVSDFNVSTLYPKEYTILKRFDSPKQLRYNRDERVSKIIEKQNELLKRIEKEVWQRKELIKFLKKLVSKFKNLK